MTQWWTGRRKPDESGRFVQEFRKCLGELGYRPGEPVPRGDFAIAVFRCSRRFTSGARERGDHDRRR